jgi:hypothetical protein
MIPVAKEHSRDGSVTRASKILAMLTTRALRQRRMDQLATPRWDSGIAKLHLRTLRVSKLDKECVAIVTLPKCGSTLLCYVTALVNTRNTIQNFRNDFHLVPMLLVSGEAVCAEFQRPPGWQMPALQDQRTAPRHRAVVARGWDPMSQAGAFLLQAFSR